MGAQLAERLFGVLAFNQIGGLARQDIKHT
jgi:hypothetical protein